MNCIEVIGGIKQEAKLIKEEYQENDANTVEIGLEDIIGKEQDSSEESEASEDENICPKKNVLQKGRVVSKHDRNEDTAKTLKIEHANNGCEKKNEQNKALDIKIEHGIDKIESNKKDRVVSNHHRIENKAKTVNIEHASDGREKNNEQNKALYIKIERIVDKIESVKKKNILISSSKHARLGEPNSSCNENNLDNKEGILTEGQNLQEQEENEVLHINFLAENDRPQQPIKQRNISSRVRNYEIICEAPDRFICVYCKAVRKKKRNLRKHIRTHHRENVKMIQCPHCPYKSKYDIKYHVISIHTDLYKVEWFRCHQCDYKCKLKNLLRRHIHNTHMNSMVYGGLKQCTVCNKRFQRNCGLRVHMLHVHDKKLHRKNICQICNYSTTIKAQLENHIDVHHTDINKLETIKCDECKYTTKYKQRFIAHKRRRHSQNMFQCHICAYQTKGSSVLKLHLISHQKEKKEEDLKYKCTECSYKTHRQYNLSIHKMKHKKPSEIEYFQCNHCPFKANRKDNLKSHIYRHYKQNDVTHSCYICEFKTNSKSGLIKHLNKHSKMKK